jgi:hypothetical protein
LEEWERVVHGGAQVGPLGGEGEGDEHEAFEAVGGVRLQESAPARKPLCHCPVRFQRRQNNTPKSSLAVDEHAFVVAEIAELVRFDFVLVGFGEIHAALSRT